MKCTGCGSLLKKLDEIYLATDMRTGWVVECRKEKTDRHFDIQAGQLLEEEHWADYLNEKRWFMLGDFEEALQKIGLELKPALENAI